MLDNTWLEPLDRRIEEVRRETEAIKKANAALKRLYANNDEGMKRLANS
jgi:cation transport regulator ChaB